MPSAEIVPISALKGENVAELLRVIKALLPESPPLMPEDEYTDQTERMIAEEVVREKIFLAMRQEIPFSTAVEVEQFVEEPDRKLVKIAALIIVERESHKGMVIGAGGQQLKKIGTEARLELEEILGRRIFLETARQGRERMDRRSAQAEGNGLLAWHARSKSAGGFRRRA